MARAPLVATLKHGERVEILGRRRRFYRLRTASGVTGWADSWQLLSTVGMEHLRELAHQTAEAPSQGQATVFDALNVHTAPNRQAPTIFQITPGMKVEVIAHEVVPRLPYTPPAPLLPALEAAKSVTRKTTRKPEYPPPPRPLPPGLPKDWLALSGGLPPARLAAPPPVAASVQMETWSLVRAREGRSGWVLARMLLMAIPDDVAQHAERARIAAFFHVGDTLDRNGTAHPAWLWAASSRQEADFDSLRLFTWNTRRHRYETSYIERNLKGFLPILLERRSGDTATAFSAVVVEKDGSLQTRRYSVNAFRVRLASRHAATLPGRWYTPEEIKGQPPQLPASDQPAPAWRDRLPAWVPFLSRRPSN